MKKEGRKEKTRKKRKGRKEKTRKKGERKAQRPRQERRNGPNTQKNPAILFKWSDSLSSIVFVSF